MKKKISFAIACMVFAMLNINVFAYGIDSYGIKLFSTDSGVNRVLFGSFNKDSDTSVNYSDIEAVVTLSDGRPTEKVKITDEIKASLTGVNQRLTYCWQGSDNGETFFNIDNANKETYTVSYSDNYKYIRCLVKFGRLVYKSSAVEVLEETTKAPGNVKPDKEHNLFGERENSNEEYIFYVDDKGFIILDDYCNKESEFYVTTTQAYGDAINAYCGRSETDVNSNKIKANKFVSAHGALGRESDGSDLSQLILGNGNDLSIVSDGGGGEYALPISVSEYVSRNINFKFWSAGWLKNKHFYNSPQKGNVWFLCWDDFVTYSDRLGYRDDVFENGGDCYFLRDTTPNENWYSNSVMTKDGVSKPLDNAKGLVRPAFYLKRDFFLNTKIDLNKAGAGVIDILKNHYTTEELSSLYSAKELSDYGFKSEGLFKRFFLNYTEKFDKVEILLKNNQKEPRKITVLIGILNTDGRLVGALSDLTVLNPNEEIKKIMDISIPESECEIIASVIDSD